MNQMNQSYVSQYNSKKLVGCTVLTNSNGRKLREVVGSRGARVIAKRTVYVSLNSSHVSEWISARAISLQV